MIEFTVLQKICLSLPEATEEPHFEKTSFRVKKKIFATYDSKNHKACVKLSEIDQQVFCSFDASIIYPVPNKWGKQGWTLIDLNKVQIEILKDIITTSYCEVAPAKLSAQLK